MASTTNVSTGFVGALAGEIFVQAFKKSDTIEKGAITVLPNVLGSAFLPKLSYTAAMAAYTCGWSPTGTVTYLDKQVIVKKFKIDDELCKETFAHTFQAQAAGLFNANPEIPASIEAAILDAMVKNMGKLVDAEIWQGAGGVDHFDGLLPQLVADAATINIVGTATVTKANVVATLESLYNAIPAELDPTDVIIVVSRNVANAYKQAQASMGLNTTVGDKDMDYLGVRMESLGGLPSHTALAYRVKNVAFLTGLESNINEIRISDDQDRLDGNVRTKMTFTGNVGYSFASEIVYLRP